MREFLLAETAAISISADQRASRERRRVIYDRRHRHLYRCSFQEAKAVIVGEFERSYLTHVLEESHGNISKAARRSGKERRTFAKLMDKHGIGKRQFVTE